MKLLEFPVLGINDIPSGLRKIADAIETGEYGDAHNLAWIIDCGEKRIEFGLLGHSPLPGNEFNLLLDLAKYRFVSEL